MGQRAPELERAKELVTQALHAALREDWPAAGKAMTAVSTETGGQGIYYAIRLLCDTAIGQQRRAGTLADTPGPYRPGWMNAETGAVTLDADAVPAPARWAARLVTARAAMDQEAYHGLLAGMPEDGAERGAYAAALLHGTALAVKAAQDGGGR